MSGRDWCHENCSNFGSVPNQTKGKTEAEPNFFGLLANSSGDIAVGYSGLYWMNHCPQDYVKKEGDYMHSDMTPKNLLNLQNEGRVRTDACRDYQSHDILKPKFSMGNFLK